MKPRNLALAAAATIGLAGGALAQEGQNTTPLKVESGDTLSEIAQSTGTTVSELMSLNPEITDRFGTVCAGVRVREFFCTAPEHTIFPGDEIVLDRNSVGDISETLRAGGIEEERLEDIQATIERGIINIPGLTVENATQVAIALERIPKDRSVAILIDNSGSTNNDRELISQFVRFFISDWEARKDIVSQEGDTNTVRTYAYSTFPVEVTGNEDEYVNTGDGGTENNVFAIQNAFENGAQHVVVITDEAGDDNQREAIDGQPESTTIFVIDDAAYGAIQGGYELNEDYYSGLQKHGTVYRLEGQGGE